MHRIGPILLCLILAWSAVALASEDEDVFTQGEIVVTGKKLPAEHTATMQEIDAADIEAMGATNVAEALQAAAAARVDTAPTSLSANGKQEHLAGLRGFDPRNVLILIDGVPIYEPYFRVLDLRQIPVGDIAKIKIMKGPTSVLYGPNALGGVINIITKKGGGPARGHVDASYGDVETYRANASVHGGAGDFEYFMAPGFAKSDGFRVSRDFDETRNEDGGVRFNSDYRDFYLSGKAVWTRAAGGLSLSANHYEFDGGVPFSMEAVEPSTLWRKHWRKTGAALHGDWAPADYLFVRGNAFYTRFYNTITTYTNTDMSCVAADGDAVSTYDNDVFGYHFLPTLIFGRAQNLALMAHYKQDKVSIQDETGAKWYDYGAETYCWGGQYGLSIGDFNFTAGGAYNFFRRTETPDEDLGEDNGAVDWQTGLAWAPFTAIEFHGGAAKKSAFPDLRSLYGSQGNPELESESALNIDAGLRASLGDVARVSSTYFQSYIEDLIGKKEMGNEFTYENIDEAEIRGVESALNLNLGDGVFRLGLAHTYMDTKDLRDDRNLAKLDFRPEHTASVDGRLNWPKNTHLAVQYYYVGEREYEQPSKDRNIMTMPEYGITNARLSQAIPIDDTTAAKVFIEAKNLFDVYYESAPEKCAPGRMLSGGLAFEF